MIDPLKIHAMVDGEVTAEESAELNALISKCEKSTAELQAIKNVKSLLARTEPVNCEDTWNACVKRLNAIDKAHRIEYVVGRYAWGMCGVIVAAIAIGGYLNRGTVNGLRTGDVPRMVSGLVPFSSFNGDSPQAARQWLDANVESLPMSGQQLQLVRGIVGRAPDGHRVARLTLRDGGGDMALIVIFGVNQFDGLNSDGQFRLGMIEDAHCVSWRKDGNAMLLVGDRSAEELQAVASHISIEPAP